MPKRRLGSCFGALAIFASTAATAEAQGFKDVAPVGTTELKASIGDQPIVVTITTHEPQAAAHSTNTRTACTGGRVQCSLVDQLAISVGGEAVFVPLSTVVTLADVNRAKITRAADGSFELLLECGDASEAYDAHIRFDRERVLERDIIGGESGLLEERTVYRDTSHAFDD
jgi:hypothetical protein